VRLGEEEVGGGAVLIFFNGHLPFVVLLLIDGLGGLKELVIVLGDYLGLGEAGVVDFDFELFGLLLTLSVSHH
jgi:hypothetical protein